jgi:hypothetical protein
MADLSQMALLENLKSPARTATMAKETWQAAMIGGLLSTVASSQASLPEDVLKSPFQDKAVQVHDFAKYFDKTQKLQEFERTACLKWVLTADEIRDFFVYAHAVSYGEIDYAFNTAPCDYHGTLRAGNSSLKFMISAGGYGFVESSPEHLWYTCAKQCTKLFPGAFK